MYSLIGLHIYIHVYLWNHDHIRKIKTSFMPWSFLWSLCNLYIPSSPFFQVNIDTLSALHISLYFLEFIHTESTMCTLYLLYFTQFSWDPYLVSISKLHFFYCSVVFHCTNVLKFIYPSTGCWIFGVASHLEALQTEPLWIFMHQYLCRHMLSFLLCKCLRGEWPEHMVGVHLTFQGTVKLLFKVVVPFCTHTSRMRISVATHFCQHLVWSVFWF